MFEIRYVKVAVPKANMNDITLWVNSNKKISPNQKPKQKEQDSPRLIT